MCRIIISVILILNTSPNPQLTTFKKHRLELFKKKSVIIKTSDEPNTGSKTI